MSNMKPGLIVALVMTAVTILCFVLATPLVPIADTQVWLWIGLIASAATAVAWAGAVRGMADRDQGSLRP